MTDTISDTRASEPPNKTGGQLRIDHVQLTTLRPNPRNARTHSRKQVGQIAESIRQFGFNNPLIVDSDMQVLAGHGRLQAVKRLGLKGGPVVCLDHLNDVEKRAYVLADNKLALSAGWDSELLAVEIAELEELLDETKLELTITGFEVGEIDVLLSDHEDPQPGAVAEDELPAPTGAPVTQPGDLWQLGQHRLLCGDARDAAAIADLFDGATAGLAVSDPPYNVKIQGHVGGRGKVKHNEFAFASGEMSEDAFASFLRESITPMAAQLAPGGLLYLFMDWRHIELLLRVGRELDLHLINICVWSKTTAGQGSFYRSAHELIAVFAKPGAQPVNNIQLGRFGRSRTNIWTYPGVNTFEAGKAGELDMHPTVKPMAMIAEAIKDASGRGQIVFDPFLGSGTTLLAAEKVGRRCYGVEYEPCYVDTAIRRWQAATGKDALLLLRTSEEGGHQSRMCFDELSASPSSDEVMTGPWARLGCFAKGTITCSICSATNSTIQI